MGLLGVFDFWDADGEPHGSHGGFYVDANLELGRVVTVYRPRSPKFFEISPGGAGAGGFVLRE